MAAIGPATRAEPSADSASMRWGKTPGSVAAATAMTCRPAAGEPRVAGPGPSLPAAATTTVPSSEAFAEATASGSSGPPEPPRLMLMTWATGLAKPATVVGDTASSMARRMSSLRHAPAALQAL